MDFRFAHSLTYLNNRGQQDWKQFINVLRKYYALKKWKVGGSSGYDFKNKGFTYTIRFERDG